MWNKPLHYLELQSLLLHVYEKKLRYPIKSWMNGGVQLDVVGCIVQKLRLFRVFENIYGKITMVLDELLACKGKNGTCGERLPEVKLVRFIIRYSELISWLLDLFISTNWILSGGSDTTRQHTNSHIKQNNAPCKKKSKQIYTNNEGSVRANGYNVEKDKLNRSLL
jgi:hypothetical protein